MIARSYLFDGFIKLNTQCKEHLWFFNKIIKAELYKLTKEKDYDVKYDGKKYVRYRY